MPRVTCHVQIDTCSILDSSAFVIDLAVAAATGSPARESHDKIFLAFIDCGRRCSRHHVVIVLVVVVVAVVAAVADVAAAGSNSSSRSTSSSGSSSSIW